MIQLTMTMMTPMMVMPMVIDAVPHLILRKIFWAFCCCRCRCC